MTIYPKFYKNEKQIIKETEKFLRDRGIYTADLMARILMARIEVWQNLKEKK